VKINDDQNAGFETASENSNKDNEQEVSDEE
jgi:hypothetical protein